MNLNRLYYRVRSRVLALFDLTAWVLLVVSCVPLYFLNPAMLLTLAQWTAFALALAGIAVILSRALLPQLDLSHWLQRASGTPNQLAAAVVVLGVLQLLGFLFVGVVLWAKA